MLLILAILLSFLSEFCRWLFQLTYLNGPSSRVRCFKLILGLLEINTLHLMYGSPNLVSEVLKRKSSFKIDLLIVLLDPVDLVLYKTDLDSGTGRILVLGLPLLVL